MKLVRMLKYAGPAVLLSLLFAAPALAQFEVNPDHFDNSQTTNSKKPVQKAKGQQAKQDASKPADAKSSTNATAGAGSASQDAQPSGQANRASTAAKSSGPSSPKLKSQGKTRTAWADRHLSAQVAAPVPRE
jgi:hypothetical protein